VPYFSSFASACIIRAASFKRLKITRTLWIMMQTEAIRAELFRALHRRKDESEDGFAKRRGRAGKFSVDNRSVQRLYAKLTEFLPFRLRISG
jgi:hypothetical protein